MTPHDHISPLPPDVQASLAGRPADEQAALLEAWLLAGDAPEADVDRQAADWQAVRRRLARDDRPPMLRLVSQPLRLAVRNPYGIAATVLVLIGVLSLFGLSDRSLTAPIGAEIVTNTTLPDGSSVLLSPGSTIRYARDFVDDQRHVELRGEAFFDVVPAEEPFIVETFNAHVEVLGTAFNVRAWPDAASEDTRVYVTRGAVRVAAERMQDMDVHLVPGQETVITGDALPSEPVELPAEEALAWRNGGMTFVDAPIGDLLDEVERRFNVDIRAPEDVRLSRISYFKYSVTDSDQILSDVVDATGLRYRRMSRGYEIYIP